MPANIERLRPRYLVVGEILRPHGVRGEVRMRLVTEYPEHLKTLETLYLGKSPGDKKLQSFKLNNLRFNKEYALLTIDGFKNREDADRLRGSIVFVDIASAMPLEKGEYYLFQLIGLRVIADEREIGVVKNVLETGANDVYVVQSVEHGEVLIPAHQETIESIDFDRGIISMTLPDGLLIHDQSLNET